MVSGKHELAMSFLQVPQWNWAMAWCRKESTGFRIKVGQKLAPLLTSDVTTERRLTLPESVPSSIKGDSYPSLTSISLRLKDKTKATLASRRCSWMPIPFPPSPPNFQLVLGLKRFTHFHWITWTRVLTLPNPLNPLPQLPIPILFTLRKRLVCSNLIIHHKTEISG